MSTRRILMIDDEETIQTVVQFGIKMTAGWDVLAAHSGTEGLQTARIEKPDAILLDMMMPDMDGISTFHALQSDPETASIPVIFLTATVQTGESHSFNHSGVSGVITKPFNALQLSDQIARILHWLETV